MKKTIHTLRQKPEHIKRQIVYVVAGVCAILLFILWTANVRTHLISPDTRTVLQKDSQPFTILKDTLVNGYNSVSNDPTNNTN